MRAIAGEVETSSEVIYSSGPLHMNEQKQDDQLESTYRIQDVPISEAIDDSGLVREGQGIRADNPA